MLPTGEAEASFEVFFRFQVTDFDLGSFFLCHVNLSICLFWLFVLVVWKPHRGIEPTVRLSLSLFRDVELSTALGILHWLQVFDFDVLLFLSWHFSLPLLGCLLFLLCQWHRRAIDARP